MKPTQEEWYAARLLHLLLDASAGAREAGGGGSSAPTPAGGTGEAEILLSLARQNGVLIRTAERLERAGIPTPADFVDAVEAERRRVRTALHWIATISALCAESGLEFLFPKALQHYPDMGQDLDLLLLSRSTRAEEEIIRALPASRCPGSLAHRIAGTTCYRIEGCALPLDVHHGRLGLAGEHAGYPATMIRNQRRVTIDGVTFMLSSREDQLVLQGMQKLYGRRCLRLSDIVATMALVRESGLDWDYVAGTSRRLGTLPGLSGYLRTVDAIHARVFGSELLTREQSRRLERGDGEQAAFRAGCYRLPAGRVAARLYGRKLLGATAAGDWSAAGRLCLLPLVVLFSSMKGHEEARRGAGQGSGLSVRPDPLRVPLGPFVDPHRSGRKSDY